MLNLEQAVCTNCKEERFIHKTYRVCKPCFEKIEEVSRCSHLEGRPRDVKSVDMVTANDKLVRVTLLCENCVVARQLQGDDIFDQTI